MKKCSDARIKRRLEKKKLRKETNNNLLTNNKCWDELEMMAGAVVGALFTTKEITPILRNEELVDKMGREEVTTLSRVIANDINSLKNRVMETHEKHKDKTGGSSNIDEIMESLLIGDEYREITEAYSNVVLPNITRILDMAKECINKEEQENIETTDDTTPVEETHETENEVVESAVENETQEVSENVGQ